jgi:hypothetical protein
MRWRGAVATLAVSALALALAPAAQALITGSHVTKPSDPRYLLFNEDDPNTFGVKGTTSGGNPATDTIDLDCFHGDDFEYVAQGVPLAGDGSFSVPNADLEPISYELCRLRAVPHAPGTPSNLTPFRGPLLGVSGKQDQKSVSGPNMGHVYDHYFWAQQRRAAFDYLSITGCGLDDGYLYAPNLDLTTYTFYCNAFLDRGENYDDFDSSTRSELQIDGKDAYGASSAEGAVHDASNLPAVQSSFTIDPLTGNAVIHEKGRLVRCPGADAYPPTPVNCPKFVSAHVKYKRTIVQDHTGLLTMLATKFISTDRHSHHLDLLWQNDQRFWRDSGLPFDSTDLEYRFPGEQGYAVRSLGDKVDLPRKTPRAIFVRMQGRPDGDRKSGRGAIVYGDKTKGVTINGVSSSTSDFYFRQVADVPKQGAARSRFAYVQAYDQDTVDALTHKALKALG